MEQFLILAIILFCFFTSYLIKLTEKINYNKGREKMLNDIYSNGDLTNQNYLKYRSTFITKVYKKRTN